MDTDSKKDHKKRMRRNQKLRKDARLHEIFNLIAGSASEFSAWSGEGGDSPDTVIAEFFKPIQNRWVFGIDNMLASMLMLLAGRGRVTDCGLWFPLCAVLTSPDSARTSSPPTSWRWRGPGRTSSPPTSWRWRGPGRISSEGVTA